ncbi:PREDICTED: cuticle protein CP14.6-like [Nicrophorus vespilloides]|uniref:Cuticle protein CP14.6-like n=1 Tax=Nicrophorus vespilloides TaxID=110193 RepID=A0ABM1N2Z9_NICVS|nr:PREDICTED: cuticle protein CP14.6-like [Nicrophorus vespilloides]
MKSVFVALAFLAVAAAVEDVVQILRQEADVGFDGTYKHAFETSDGIAVEEHGVLKNAGSENAAVEATGSYEFTAPDGIKYALHYVADENGFQPQADFLPTPPPIPAAIQRALDYIASHPQPLPQGKEMSRNEELSFNLIGMSKDEC